MRRVDELVMGALGLAIPGIVVDLAVARPRRPRAQSGGHSAGRSGRRDRRRTFVTRVGGHCHIRCNVHIRCNFGSSHASHAHQSTQQPGRPSAGQGPHGTPTGRRDPPRADRQPASRPAGRPDGQSGRRGRRARAAFDRQPWRAEGSHVEPKAAKNRAHICLEPDETRDADVDAFSDSARRFSKTTVERMDSAGSCKRSVSPARAGWRMRRARQPESGRATLARACAPLPHSRR